MADHASCDAPAVKPIKRADGKSEKQAAAEKAVGAAIDLLFVSLAHTFAVVVWFGLAKLALAHTFALVLWFGMVTLQPSHIVPSRCDRALC